MGRVIPDLVITLLGTKGAAKALKAITKTKKVTKAADRIDDVSDVGKILQKSKTVRNFNKFLKPEELRHIGVPGRNYGIREVVGTEIEARQLFNQQIEKSTLKEVKPGVFVGKDKNEIRYSFRAKSSEISAYVPTIDVNGIDGLRKIKFVEK